ncbi:DUF1456 family protein [Cytophaga hutchinsonii]|uniref:DUF1456 family protein n=1 Tax=Cytophaga hutchinsonii (strain ATCC 33406 / DSM 1761 / CIP 103989 / NBRC 15051 / NCIMB 9469 / D465) TaxID=269798 RepID=A0A6N4SV18_CYTH3|nr:DUF1456 family protein [Cytophaga hutchinsonii]ABG60338.1 conserved hypothetical protein [Cytophaga hutchinsonii ATCC 33406]SFX98752.1 Uncharacterized conserved protein YehS, DUF1456 family [Cytophaga hutchinsonii ATCC 33406]
MNNNDIIRRLRYTFDFNDDKMIQLFALADQQVTRAEISNWMKKDDDPDFKELYDKELAVFLNGFIIDKRGKKDGQTPVAEKSLNNNIIFRKLKIALNLQDDDILDILELADMRFGKHELSALFRNPDQSQFRPCKDQVLRNFIHGLQLKYRKE